MIVRCVRLLDSAGKAVLGTSDGWLTVNREYLVIEIHCTANEVSFRVLADDDQTPILVPGEALEVVDRVVPRSWSVFVEDQLAPAFTIGPEQWRGDFWNRFFNADSTARGVFLRSVEEMMTNR